MKIVGTNYYNDHLWHFELEDTCYGYVNFVTELTFNDGYNDFKYQFKDIKEFQEQYSSQEKNLFKEFFNDSTIDYDSLNFDFGDYDIINIFEKTEELNPFLYNYIQYKIPDWYYELTNSIQDDFECTDKEYMKFSYYLKDLTWYATEEVNNETILGIFSFLFCNGMDLYSINEIKELSNEGTIDLARKLFGCFDERDEKYIDFALSY